MERSRNAGVVSVLGLIVVLGIAVGLDALMAYLARRNAQTFELYNVILWSRAFSSLLLAALLLLLFWYVIARAPRSAGVAALYLVVGLFVAFFQLLYFVPAIGGSLPSAFSALLALGTSYTLLAGSLIAISGLFMLILPRAA